MANINLALRKFAFQLKRKVSWKRSFAFMTSTVTLDTSGQSSVITMIVYLQMATSLLTLVRILSWMSDYTKHFSSRVIWTKDTHACI